ncbi:MAG: YsnF/AvaK domain-containing protein [Terracidiphilus sp.]
MAWEKVVTAYDSADKAKNAVRVLQDAGYNASDLSIIDRTALQGNESDRVGLWRRLFGENVWDHEAAVYGDTIEKGGALLVARVPDDQVARTMVLLDVHKPIDIHDAAARMGEQVPAQARAQVAATPPPAAKVEAKDSETLRLAEEQLNIDKRLLQTGTTRIRRFVTERPIEQKVTLHEEHAEVVRKAITNPSSIADVDWSDKSYEITETAEQAVVNKTARVVEEVILRKTGSDRVETVKDTVRRQQIEVEKAPARPMPRP